MGLLLLMRSLQALPCRESQSQACTCLGGALSYTYPILVKTESFLLLASCPAGMHASYHSYHGVYTSIGETLGSTRMGFVSRLMAP